MTPFDNMPLLTVFAIAALPSVDGVTPRERAEKAFALGRAMMEVHNENKVASGPMRLLGDISPKGSNTDPKI